jgi:lipopolysaccharide transport system permease protein
MFRALWHYRGFVLGSIKREFQLRYLGSSLGFLWTIINPLAMIAVYTLVFSRIMRARLVGSEDGLAYSIFLCSGVFAWGYLSEVISRSVGMFLEQANLLKKNAFPRICLPTIVLGSATVNFVIIFTLFLIVLACLGRFPGVVVLGILPLLLVQQLLAVGLGLALGTLNVFYRDVGHVTNIVLQFWFWLTPVVYPSSILPERIRDLAELLNPMTRLIAGYQDVMLYGKWPEYSAFGPHALVAAAVMLVGLVLYKRLVGAIVDEV